MQESEIPVHWKKEVHGPNSIADAKKALGEGRAISFAVGMPETPPPDHLRAAQTRVLEIVGIKSWILPR